MTEGDEFDRHGFASAFARFIETMNTEAVPLISAVRAVAEAALGADPSELPVVSEDVAVYDQPNLQLALERWLAEGAPGRTIVAKGLAAPGLRYMGLERIERHTIDFGRHAARLRDAGRALRRGVLAPICQLARDLAPAMVVLEDVDLVALEPTMMGPGRNPLLFTLMNEMDGIGSDADVVFLLTTNRADLVEPALAARPGRIDLAVEIPVPDAPCRQRLIDLYARGLRMQLRDVEAVRARTEGVSAAFIKELLRRASLIAASGDDHAATDLTVGDVHVNRALDEMLSDGGRLTRAILGASVEADDGDQVAGMPPGMAIPPQLRSMLAGGGAVVLRSE